MPIQPPFLKSGDTVLIIATARKISRAEIEPVRDVLASWGFRVELGPHLFSEHDQFAGTDEERASDLQWALDHPHAGAIFIARGGYGTVRIVDQVIYGGFISRPKWVCGYSDITVLHSHLHRLGYCSLHCTMPVNFLRHRESTLSVKELLCGTKATYKLPPHRLNLEGEAEGELIGGNLSVLYSICGSASEPNLRNKILFLEDVDEYLYHIDRMLTQLRRCGKLERLAGLVVGGMTDMKDNAVPFGKDAETIIRDSVTEYGYPVCFGFPAGHGDENLAFYHGKRVRLRVRDSGAIIEQL